MAHSEACQLFIEEQIKEGLEEGKTPYSIGKELVVMVERLFKAAIPHDTLERRAERMRDSVGTKVPNGNSSDIPTTSTNLEKLEKTTHGGKREGAGRPKREVCDPEGELTAGMTLVSDAISFAGMAISQLERILPDDPMRVDAWIKVRDWCNERISKAEKRR